MLRRRIGSKTTEVPHVNLGSRSSVQARGRRAIWARIGLFVIAAVLALLALRMAASMAGTGTDFVEYWSASRLLLHGGNPYDPQQMLVVQRELGLSRSEPLLMLNPPWSLPLILPLGAMRYPASQSVWLIVNLLALVLAVQLCLQLYAGHGMSRGVAWTMGLTFLPALTCIAIGQISALVLLGVLGFVYLRQRGSDWSAGACLLLAAIKPHCVWLVWPALLFWGVRRGRRNVLFGFVSALACATGLALMLDARAFQHWWGVLHSYGVVRRDVPTAWGWLMFSAGVHSAAIRFVPLAFGLAWLGWSYMKRSTWCWRERLPMLVLVSLATSVYGWYFDQIVALPALFSAARYLQGRPRTTTSWALATYAVVNLAPLVLVMLGYRVYAYAWTAPAWLSLYVITSWRALHSNAAPDTMAAASDIGTTHGTPERQSL